MTLPAGIRHDYGAVDQWNILWFHLIPAPHWNALLPREPNVLEASLKERVGTIGGEFLLELDRSEHADNLDLLNEFTKVLSLLIRRELAGGSPRNTPIGPHERLSKLWTLVGQQPATTWTVGRLAGEAGLSRSHLQFLVKRLYGVGAMERVAQLRMRTAGRLLRDPAAKVSVIASEMGYESPYAFSRAFKRVVGLSPRQFRLINEIPIEEESGQ